MSENKDYFYESLLNLYHDKSDPKIPNFSEQYSYIPDTEILEGGGWFQVDGLGTFFPVKHRIYINCLNKNLIPLSKKFAGHCIERDLPFVFKADSIGSNRDDALVIYSSTDSYEEYIEILRRKIPKVLLLMPIAVFCGKDFLQRMPKKKRKIVVWLNRTIWLLLLLTTR